MNFLMRSRGISSKSSPGAFLSRSLSEADDAEASDDCDDDDANDADVNLPRPEWRFMMWSDSSASNSSFGLSTRMKT